MTDGDTNQTSSNANATVTVDVTDRPTIYVVLRQVEDRTWVEDGPHQTARSAAAARQAAAQLRIENGLDGEGVYVAVPTRSWSPVPLRPRVVFDEAS